MPLALGVGDEGTDADAETDMGPEEKTTPETDAEIDVNAEANGITETVAADPETAADLEIETVADGELGAAVLVVTTTGAMGSFVVTIPRVTGIRPGGRLRT